MIDPFNKNGELIDLYYVTNIDNITGDDHYYYSYLFSNLAIFRLVFCDYLKHILI